MLKVKNLKEIIKDMPDEADVLIESIIDNDDALWTTTTKAWVDIDVEGGNKPCLVLQPTDVQICNGDVHLAVVEGIIIEPLTIGEVHDKSIELLKEFAFVDPDESMTDRRQAASDVQEILRELGQGDWIDKQIEQNRKDFEDSVNE